MSDMLPSWGGLEAPYSQEAEEATIGAILVNPVAYYQIKTFLQKDDFFILRHRYVWQALERLHERGEVIDYLTVVQELKDTGRLAEIGGAAFLTQLINATPTSVHGEVYARLVLSFATRRRILAASDEIKALALNGELTLDEIIQQSASLLKPFQGLTMKKRPRNMVKIVDAVWNDLEVKLESKRTTPGISTGFWVLDRILGGWAKKTLVITAARPGMGKSASMTEWARRVANQINPDTEKPYNVFISSLEMSAEEIAGRIIRNNTGLSNADVLKPYETEEERKAVVNKLISGMGVVSGLPIYIDDTAPQSPASIKQAILDLERSEHIKIDMLFVDYLGLLKEDDYEKNEVLRLGQLSRDFKLMAGELDIPIVVLHQLNREVEDKRTKRADLSNLRGSGRLEEDADIVIFPFFEGYYSTPRKTRGNIKWDIAKHRNGATGDADCYVDFATMRFNEI